MTGDERVEVLEARLARARRAGIDMLGEAMDRRRRCVGHRPVLDAIDQAIRLERVAASLQERIEQARRRDAA